mmetsp:Transcript_8087/g.16504  ORF Transcript_8087/g.16504 Transcript_8087/m.16504 type:complete len:82 (+) Transcript_8087:25-270(+)
MTTLIITVINFPNRYPVTFKNDDKILEVAREMCAKFQVRTIRSIVDTDNRALDLNATVGSSELCMYEVLTGTTQDVGGDND